MKSWRWVGSRMGRQDWKDSLKRGIIVCETLVRIEVSAMAG